MDKIINPFHELYVTETISPERFVNLFSPFLVKHSLALFQPGNIVLKGVRGSGKSMLLRLLKPETRIAYEKAKIEFPVPVEFRKYISAGINLLRSGIQDFGQRPMSLQSPDDEILPLFFGDFLNYWIVIDILKTIEKFNNEVAGKIAAEIGLNARSSAMDAFAKAVAADDCWFGYLGEVQTLDQLHAKLISKINIFRSFLNYNIDALPSEVVVSKTSVGVPISKTVKYLRDFQIIPNDVDVFIAIDQYEELMRLTALKEVGHKYCQIVNKAIGSRDPQVSYRIGSRRYGWSSEQHVYGTTSSLEEGRDYKTIDLDETLRRKENRRTWIFPDFAEEVFQRRLKLANISVDMKGKSFIKEIFGEGLGAEELAKKYGGISPQRAISVNDDWPQQWVDFLKELALTDPLSARLGEAWSRQKGAEKEGVMSRVPRRKPYPWEKKLYWKKERIDQALMQIAARCGQRMIWAGESNIITLSGGNILLFLSICQHIWSAWVRDMRGYEKDMASSLPIDYAVQSIGIHEASSYWYDEIPKEIEGNTRQRFIQFIGVEFYSKLYDDYAMSYPGSNGFSVKIKELDSDARVNKFLQDAVDFGALHDAPHTTKTKDKEKRRKWYLNPILSPYFRVPVPHTKEPLYVTIKQVNEWLIKCGVIVDEFLKRSAIENKEKSPSQMTLFDKDKR